MSRLFDISLLRYELSLLEMNRKNKVMEAYQALYNPEDVMELF